MMIRRRPIMFEVSQRSPTRVPDAMLRVLAQSMELQMTTRTFKEGRTWVAQALELDGSSCGGTKENAVKRLREAVRLFVEAAERMGTLDQILEEAVTSGFSTAASVRRDRFWQRRPAPEIWLIQAVVSPCCWNT